MKCRKCGQEIEANAPSGVVICGSCADDLRQEEKYQAFIAEQESINDQMNKEAYEESLREEHFDTGGGYRYI